MINLYNKRKRNNQITIEEIDEVIPDCTYSIDEHLIKNEALVIERENQASVSALRRHNCVKIFF